MPGTMPDLTFNSWKNISISVEMQMQVLDDSSLLLVPRASEIVKHAKSTFFKSDIVASTLSFRSSPTQTIHELEVETKEALNRMRTVCEENAIALAASGTNPSIGYRDQRIVYDERYHELTDRNQFLLRRMSVYSMRIHLTMTSASECIEFVNFFKHFVPHLIACSASSPFWQGLFTGVVSSRATVYEGFPTTGILESFTTWNEFNELVDEFVASSAINNVNDLLWDVRPNPAEGTVEILCCDQPATVGEVLAIVAFVQLLASWFSDNRDNCATIIPVLPMWMSRENRWRAIQRGPQAQILIGRAGKMQLLSQSIKEWDHRLSPYIKKFGYEKYMGTLINGLRRGVSAQRQFEVFARRNDLSDVIRHNVQEFMIGMPIYPQRRLSNGVSKT